MKLAIGEGKPKKPVGLKLANGEGNSKKPVGLKLAIGEGNSKKPVGLKLAIGEGNPTGCKNLWAQLFSTCRDPSARAYCGPTGFIARVFAAVVNC